MFGGSETTYSLRLKADIPNEELSLLKKYGEDNANLELPPELRGLIGKDVTGLNSIPLAVLAASGQVFDCKYLPSSFCDLPGWIIEEYKSILGRIRAKEEWDGSESLVLNYFNT